MPVVDLIIAALTLAIGAWGYRHGVMTKPLVLVGFLGGTLLGSWVAPPVLGAVLPDPYAPMLAVPAVLSCGVLLAVALERVASELRRRRRRRGRGKLEPVGGALLAAVVGLWTIWFVAALVGQVDALRGPVDDSAIVAGLDAVVPSPGPLVNAEDSDPLRGRPGPGGRGGPERVNVTRDPEIRAAKASVVKIGVLACGSGRQGSGWIAGDGIVVTNAHVVAQSDLISLQVEGKGERHGAEAIWYDEVNDLAILRSPGVSGERALPIDPTAERGAPLAMLGFPDGGSYAVKPARLGVSSKIPGLQIEGDYVERRVTRVITSAHPGNSGGPLVDPDGRVVGVVFARGGYTAYAVLASTAQRALQRAEGPVDTGACEEDG